MSVIETGDGVSTQWMTSLQTENWEDDALLRQLMAATKNTAIVDGRVEEPASEENLTDGRYVTSRNINGELVTLRMVSESSSWSKSADVPTPESAAVTAGDGRSVCPQRHFVVVAVDFGTALSGYAFAFVRDPCRAIHMMRRWDGGDPGVVNQKTPTTLLLDPVGRFHSFGYTARDFYHDLDEDEARQWLFFDKFKMTLHHNDVMINMSIQSLTFIILLSYGLQFCLLTKKTPPNLMRFSVSNPMICACNVANYFSHELQ